MESRRRNDGSYYVNIVVELPTEPTGKTPRVIGVDLGRRDIATTSTNKAGNGSHLQSVRDRYSRNRSNVQRKRTRSSRKLLRRLSGRERRFQKHINHVISKELVCDAKSLDAALAFEMRDFGGNNSSQNSLDLTNIRESLNEKQKNKTERRRSNNWAFYQLRLFTQYKGAVAGIPIIFVPAAYTSKTCDRTHAIGERNGKKFSCKRCGLEHIDSDYNAALNIAALGLSVNQPEIRGIACQLEGQLSLLPVGGEILDKAHAIAQLGAG